MEPNSAHAELVLSCAAQDTMLWLRMENPKAKIVHRHLWNGAYATGTLTLSEKGTSGSVVRVQLAERTFLCP